MVMFRKLASWMEELTWLKSAGILGGGATPQTNYSSVFIVHLSTETAVTEKQSRKTIKNDMS